MIIAILVIFTWHLGITKSLVILVILVILSDFIRYIYILVILVILVIPNDFSYSSGFINFSALVACSCTMI